MDTKQQLALVKELRANEKHAEARDSLLALATQFPADPDVQYETACVHDFLGLEREAVPYYHAAIQNGLSGTDLRGAYLGLGSTYRTLGMYRESKHIFEEGLRCFREANEIKVFLAMTHYNLSEHQESMKILLHLIVDTTADMEIKSHAKAIFLYADELNRIWE